MKLSSASELCGPIQSIGEGHWPIREASFTKENAERAVKELGQIVSDLEKGDMYLVKKYSLDRESLLENNYLLIKGYSMKSLVEKTIDENKELSEVYKKDFCLFLKNEAMVRH